MDNNDDDDKNELYLKVDEYIFEHGLNENSQKLYQNKTKNSDKNEVIVLSADEEDVIEIPNILSNGFCDVSVSIPIQHWYNDEACLPYMTFSQKSAIFKKTSHEMIKLIQTVIPTIKENVAIMSKIKELELNLISFNKNEIFVSSFNYNELSTLEKLIAQGHTTSIVIFSRILMSNQKYPPAKLLSFLMNKSILENESAEQAFELLNYILTIYPPDTDFLKEKHIYLESLIISDKSSLNNFSAHMSVNLRTFKWMEMDQISSSWKFVSGVIRTALSTTSEVQNRNATTLLTGFLKRLITNDTRVMKDLFSWQHHRVITNNPAFFELCGFYYESVKEEFRQQTQKDIIKRKAESAGTNKCLGHEKSNATRIKEALYSFIEAFIKFSAVSDTNRDEITRLVANVIVKQIKDSPLQSPQTLKHFLNCLATDVGFYVSLTLFSREFRPLLHNNKTDIFLDLTFSSDLYSLISFLFCFVPKIDFKRLRQQKKKKLKNDLYDFDALSANEKEQLKKQKIVKENQKTSVNKRNLKGETELHKACSKNLIHQVQKLLLTPGIDPNAACNVGWTPLAKACMKESTECVVQLLALPLGTASPGDPIEGVLPAFCIDLEACPEEEDLTPLHDAVSNNRLQIGKLLMQKGSHTMLTKPNKYGKSPLDMSATLEIKNNFQKIAEEIAETSNIIKESFPDRLKNQPPHICQLVLSNYDEIADIRTESERKIWTTACENYLIYTKYFIEYYLHKYQLIELVMLITMPKKIKRCVEKRFGKSSSNSTCGGLEDKQRLTGSKMSIRRLMNDLIILLKWNEVKYTLSEHVNRLANIPLFGCQVDIKVELGNDLLETMLPEALKLARDKLVIVID